MKKKSRIWIPALALTLAFLLGACAAATGQAMNKQEYPLKIWKQNENGPCQTWNVVDEETGVNYIVVYAYDRERRYGISVSVTPRLNADGTLYVSGQNKQ